ncbi:MAG TPA: DNA repair protein RecN [Syntrophorhabdaceae bacterium]|nr:DNA repair protein RecN [Syntrophorhabdaceae bacterium]HPU29338.1 DNA repair protein RecN [Syntrophorhabdaceae bacterium]
MLTFLKVKDFAIIDEMEVDFENGFNVITGETGAGKSIIINALSTFLNQKVSPEVLKTSAKQAEITAHFLEGGKEYILKRVILASGRSRAYLNGEPITLTRMEEIANSLIHIYGQNEYRDLLEKEQYIKMVDNILKIDGQREILKEKVKELRELEGNLKIMIKEAGTKEKEIAFLEFQIDEIEKANLKEGEEDSLKERLRLLKEAEKIKSILKEVETYLYENDTSTHNSIYLCLSLLKPYRQIQLLNSILERLESLSYEVDDLYRDIKERSKTVFDDPDELKKVEERLSKIYTIKEKYGKTLQDIDEYYKNAKVRLKYLLDLSENIKEMEKKIAVLDRELKELADFLSNKRKQGVLDIEKMVMEELKMLAMENTVFHIEIKDKGFIDEDGKDDIEFLISPNPGEALKPLRKIASGGELSRIMLAIKRVMGNKEDKTLIFDEIDTGIGGMVAEMVGLRLKMLSKTHQVICITHLPQIAVYGDNHFLVEKQQMKDYTMTDIKRLEERERIKEIARMIGGLEITDKTIQRAEEMLSNVKKGNY